MGFGSPSPSGEAAIDILWLVRAGDSNEELRFSMRSVAANLPHDRVWIAGYRPKWVSSEVRHIAVHQQTLGTKYQRSLANLLAACSHPKVSDEFVRFDDDFFVLKPMESIPVLHRGLLDEIANDYARRGSGQYLKGMRATEKLLVGLGFSDILSYELHAPMTFDKEKLAEVLRLPLQHGLKTKCLHPRTLYGNYWHVGGEESHDFKSNTFQDWPFLSTNDGQFKRDAIGRHIREMFPEPCRYEA